MSKNETVIGLFDSSLSKVPTWFKLLPWGRVEIDRGYFLVDEISAREIIQRRKERGVDMVIDFEHQTQQGKFARADGKAPAAGWIKELRIEPGVGIFALVEWTTDGRQALGSRSYRYHSPVITMRADDKRAIDVKSVGLTNIPATRDMEPLVNKESSSVGGSDAQDKDLKMSQTETKKVVTREHPSIQRALREGLLRESRIEWACKVVGLDEGVFDQWCDDARKTQQNIMGLHENIMTLRDDLGGVPSGGSPRERTIANAAREYQKAKAGNVAAPCTLREFIDESLREQNLQPVTDDEILNYPDRPANQASTFSLSSSSSCDVSNMNRQQLILKALTDYERTSSDNPYPCTRHEWINEELREAGYQAMSDKEAMDIPDGHGSLGDKYHTLACSQRGSFSGSILNEFSGNRKRIIDQAGRDYDQNKSMSAGSSRREWIEELLRENQLPPLTDDERLHIPDK